MTRTLFNRLSARAGLRTALMFPTLSLLAACSGGGWNDAGNNINGASNDISRLSPQLTGIRDSGQPANVSVDQGLFLADQGFRSGRGNPLPDRFETPTGVTINTAAPINVEEFAQIIEDLTGIRVDYEDIRIGMAAGGGATEESATADSADPFAANAELVAQSRSTSAGPLDKTFRIRHTGKLSSVLDTVASRLAADWTYEGGRILFRGPQTMTYTVWALPSETGTAATIGAGGTTFGSGSGATTTSSLTNNYWESIEQGIAGLMPENARYSINRASGTITVTGTQAVHLRVQDFIGNENRRLSRQVAIKLDVIAFTQNSDNNVSVSLEAILSNIGTGASFEAGNIVQRGAAGSISAGVAGNDGSANATIQSLSRLGRVSVVQSQSVTALNNTPTPISITSEKAFVAQVTVTETENGTPQTSIEPGVINSGINFVVTPRIMSTNDVLLNYTLNISELIGIEEFSSGGSSVQLPEMSARNFMQTVNIRSGDTVIIASSDTQSSGQDRSGPFDPSFWGLGGQRNNNIDSTQILVLMTPVVVQDSNTPRVRQ